MPQVFNIPKVEHDQPCPTLVVLFFKISLFIYVILGADWSMAKNNINKQTNFEKKPTKVEHGWSCSTLGMLTIWDIGLTIFWLFSKTVGNFFLLRLHLKLGHSTTHKRASALFMYYFGQQKDITCKPVTSKTVGRRR